MEIHVKMNDQITCTLTTSVSGTLYGRNKPLEVFTLKS